MHQRHPSVAMHPGDDERRRQHRDRHAEAATDPLRQRGLPGAERTAQEHEVARPAASPASRSPRSLHRLGRGDGQPHASVSATKRRSASSAARGAPRGPNRIAADGWYDATSRRPRQSCTRREPPRASPSRRAPRSARCGRASARTTGSSSSTCRSSQPVQRSASRRDRRAVGRRAALQHVEHGGVGSRQPDLGHQLVEQLAALADERPPGDILVARPAPRRR